MDRNIIHFDQPDLHPDLDWMLQSSLVDDRTILEELVQEYLQPLFHLTQVALGDTRLAFETACDTIAWTVYNRHRYPGGVGALVWLYQQVWLSLDSKLNQNFFSRFFAGENQVKKRQEASLQIRLVSEKLSALSPESRMIIFLSEHLGFSTEEIQLITGRSSRIIPINLTDLSSKLQSTNEISFSEQFQSFWSVPLLDEHEKKQVFDEIIVNLNRRQKQATSSRRLKIATLCGMVFISILLFLSFGSRFLPAGEKAVKIPVIEKVFTTATAQPVGIELVEKGNPSESISIDRNSGTLSDQILLEFSDIWDHTLPASGYRLLSNSGPENMAAVVQFWQGTSNGLLKENLLEKLKPGEKDAHVMVYELIDYVWDQTKLHAQIRYGGDVQKLKELVASGFPVIVEKEYRGPSVEGWIAHYETVIGYDEEENVFLVLGYAQESNQPDRVSFTQFMDEWSSLLFSYFIIYPLDLKTHLDKVIGESQEIVLFDEIKVDSLLANTERLPDLKKFFAWFNYASILTNQRKYKDAAATFDLAFKIYDGLPESLRPWRLLWYQTRPYWAYYYAGRYQDVIRLASKTLEMADNATLEESYYWRGLAKAALGMKMAAILDFEEAVSLNRNYAMARQQLNQLLYGE